MTTALITWLGSGSINIFGLPFAGKDTQGLLLAENFNGVLLSGGEILRNSIIPPHVKQAIDAGELAPTQDYIDIILPYLSKSEFKNNPLILSSVGRWHGEEDGVIQALEQSEHPLRAVVFLHIGEQTLRSRWEQAQITGARGDRADDAEDKLAVRLAEFQQKTLPVIEFYRERGLLIEIDASYDVETVYSDIVTALTDFAKRSS